MLPEQPSYDITLLYVEDDLHTRAQVVRLLERVVSKLYVAGSGLEGLESYRANLPDVVITDVQMPVMSGLDMIREIKQFAPDCQFIVLSAYCNPEHLLDCIAIGINQYSQKPIHFGNLLKSIGLCNDHIQLKRRLKIQGDQINLLSQAMEQAPTPVMITALDGAIEYVNTMFLRVTGYESSEIIGQNLRMLETDLNPPEMYRSLWQAVASESEWEGELASRRKNGQIYWESVRICPLRDSGSLVAKYLKVSQDITERKNYEDNLRFLSMHDQLTGLFNRSYFDAVFKRMATSTDYPISIVVADVDGLKQVNDTCGHGEGDQLICRSAASLMAAFRASDVVSRIGGDEFAVLLPHTDAETAQVVADRIRNGGIDSQVSSDEDVSALSLGIATAQNPSELENAMKLADERMYSDKKERKKRELSPISITAKSGLTGDMKK